MKQFSLKEYLRYNLTVIKWLGLWPKNGYSTDKLYLIYAIIVGGFFNFLLSVSLTGYVLTSSNLLEDVIGAGYFILGITATAKYFIMMKYAKMFKLLVDQEVHKSLKVELSENQNKILCDYVGFWKKIDFGYTYLCTLIYIDYIITPIFKKAPYTLPLTSWYPFDYKQPVIYVLVYFYDGIVALIDIVVNLNGATMTAGLLAYLSAECDVLVDMLRNLNKEPIKGHEVSASGQLKICVKYHQTILEYSKGVQSYFSKYLLIQFASSCASTVLVMSNLTKNSYTDIDFWILSVLQLGIWADLFIYCWYGNEVTEKSKKISYAVFESNWVLASPEFRKDLSFFIHGTQKPIKIYAINYFGLSLDTFIGILRMAYSYYMLLSQFSKDD